MITITGEGTAPTDPAELRLFAVSFCEREGDGARPIPEGGLLLELHPAAEPLSLSWAEGALRVSVATATCGPGYHAMVARFLRKVRERFAPDLLIHDDTGYLESGDEEALREAMVSWRVETGRRIAEVLARGGGPVLLGLPEGAEVAGRRSRRVVTALRTYRLTEWLEATEAVARGRGLSSVFPWWALAKDGWYWLNRGLAYLQVRRLPGRADDRRLRRALDACERARELDPELPLPYVRLARACEQLERSDEAVGHLEAAIARDPRSCDLRPWLARLYFAQGRRDDAATELEALAERCPTMAELAYEAGVVLNGTGGFERAEALLQRAARLKPKKAKYHGELAVSLAALGRYEEALAALDLALAREPENPWAWSNRAALLEELGRSTEASEAHAEVERLTGGEGA